MSLDAALKIYQGEIDERKSLVETLTHYRDGTNDNDWLIINKAIQCIKIRIKEMEDLHTRMVEKSDGS